MVIALSPPEISTQIEAGIGASLQVSQWSAPLSIALEGAGAV
jgi:hypothetical protein